MAFAAETICVQGSNERKDPFGAISMPIYQNAAYAHPGLGKSTGYDYSRCSNPTRDEVQKTVLCWNREQRHWHFLREWRQSLQ